MTRTSYEYSHYCSIRKGPIPVHVAKAEKALGRILPYGAVVHHADGDPANNENTNLVICPDEAYHNLLRIRLRAFQACGNPNWLKCYFCKEHDEQSNLRPLRKRGRTVTTFYHAACSTAYQAQRRERARRSA